VKTITDDMLIERCDNEGARANRKAAQLVAEGRGHHVLLFERAIAFWSDLAFCIMAGLTLTREQQFVATYLRKEMGDPSAWNGVVTKRGKRKAVAS